jgi:alpha-L-fucosidase
VEACRKHGLRVGLYHSLNDWSTSPNAVDALERPDECYQQFIDYVHAGIRDIMTNYGKIDVMWYDGWWPFDGKGWQAEKLNAMVRELQPGILVNGRCGLKGDFETPEQHVTSFKEPWEAAVTLNNNWGYYAGDANWKSPKEVAGMLRKCASGCGNLLLNVGPEGDGAVPEASTEILDEVGRWLEANGEAIYGTDRFEFNLQQRNGDCADFTHHGRFTARGNNFYLHVVNWPGGELAISGVECTVREVTMLSTGEQYPFAQDGGKVVVRNLPQTADTSMPVVMRFGTEEKPCIYKCGGLRVPNVPHCRYDPVSSDLLV